MSNWWELPTPLARTPVGPRFIRPLYPPSAATRGKAPSPDGKDVEAIKRGISRSGHWPWGAFDDSYSEAFATGRSGNVSENGLAGFQRQNGIDPTGWMGEATYERLRFGLVPDDLPNAGARLLDAPAVDLLYAYQREQAGPDATLRELALAKAKTYLGYKESPPGTNGNMFGAWYGVNYEPWCAIFLTYCFEQVGDSPSFVRGSRYSYVPTILADARARRNGLSVVTAPIPGDLVVYDWNRDFLPDHVGIFSSGTAFSWKAVEGNTSTSNQSNGGQVMLRDRTASYATVTFVRVAEPVSPAA